MIIMRVSRLHKTDCLLNGMKSRTPAKFTDTMHMQASQNKKRDKRLLYMFRGQENTLRYTFDLFK